MSILESTIAFLFRAKVDPEKAQRDRQRTAYLLRQITDPAESVGECLIEQPPKSDHDTTTATAPKPAPYGF